jgi:hypothetical protein
MKWQRRKFLLRIVVDNGSTDERPNARTPPARECDEPVPGYGRMYGWNTRAVTEMTSSFFRRRWQRLPWVHESTR